VYDGEDAYELCVDVIRVCDADNVEISIGLYYTAFTYVFKDFLKIPHTSWFLAKVVFLN